MQPTIPKITIGEVAHKEGRSWNDVAWEKWKVDLAVNLPLLVNLILALIVIN